MNKSHGKPAVDYTGKISTLPQGMKDSLMEIPEVEKFVNGAKWLASTVGMDLSLEDIDAQPTRLVQGTGVANSFATQVGGLLDFAFQYSVNIEVAAGWNALTFWAPWNGVSSV